MAAATRTDSRAAFSNFGACVDGYAPGSGITSSWITSGTNTLSGTSAATGFVAGAAAIYKATLGQAAQSAVASWLNTNATRTIIQSNSAGTPNRLLHTTLVVAQTVVEDAESGALSRWSPYAGAGATISPSLASPGYAGSYALRVDYTVPSGGWAGVYLSYASAKRDWSNFSGLSFAFYGTNSGNTFYVEVQDNDAPGSAGDTAERFAYYFTDTVSGWRTVSAPWSAFVRTSWQPAGAPNDGLTLTRIQGLDVSPGGGSGSFRLDQLALTP